MATKKQGLQKDVIAIFGDGSLPPEFVDRRPEVDEPTQEKRPKAASKKRPRKTAGKKASATTAVAKRPKRKKVSARKAAPKKKLREDQDATLLATERILVDSAEAVILDPPPGIAREILEKESTSVDSRSEESPVEEVDAQAVDESSIDVERPSDTTPGTNDESPAPTTEAEAEETGTCDQDENAAPVIAEPSYTPDDPGEAKELPPLGSIAFLEHLKKTMDCPKSFECCEDRFIDICKAKVSGNGKKVICLEGKHCGCRFQKKLLFKRICTCDMRQHIAREYGY